MDALCRQLEVPAGSGLHARAALAVYVPEIDCLYLACFYISLILYCSVFGFVQSAFRYISESRLFLSCCVI